MNGRPKPREPALTPEDWIEVYYALESKIYIISRGYYDDGGETPPPNAEWAAHLRDIMAKIAEVREV